MSYEDYDEDHIGDVMESAHYHFCLGEIVHYVSQYGVDSVMTDIYNYLEVEKMRHLKEAQKELCLEDQ